ncbi:ABC transporter [Streptosporangium sp. NPDC006930]|uniref:ABC transporter n=1 Tax=unclassified Streptosporangium TaxID=2632669 RepID=UPI00341B0A8B
MSTRTMAAIRFGDVLAAELIKITTLPASWIALALGFGANGLLGIVAATDTVRVAGQDGGIPIAELGTLTLSPVYAFVAIAVFAAGGEYRGGQLRVSLAAVPGRDLLFAAKLTASAAFGLVASIPAVLPGHLLRHLPAIRAGETGVDDAVAGLLALLVAYLLLGLVGFGLAVVTRTVVTPLVTLLLTPVLVSPMLQGALPHVVSLLPHEAALSLIGMPATPATALGPVAGLLVSATWATLSVVAAWQTFVRRDTM